MQNVEKIQNVAYRFMV